MKAQRARARVPAQKPAPVAVPDPVGIHAQSSPHPVLVFPGKAKTRQNSSNVAARGSSSGPDRLSSVWNSAKQIASHVGMIAKVQSARARQIGAETARRAWANTRVLTAIASKNAKVHSAHAGQIGSEMARRTWANTRVLTAVAWENGKIRISLALKNSSKLLCSAWRNASLHSSSAWRNFRAQQISRSNSKRLHVAETISLGEKRFVAVIKVDGREFLVGGGSSNVSLLAQLTGKESKESFDELLTEKMAAPEMPVPKKQPAKQARKRVAKPTAAQAAEQA